MFQILRAAESYFRRLLRPHPKLKGWELCTWNSYATNSKTNSTCKWHLRKALQDPQTSSEDSHSLSLWLDAPPTHLKDFLIYLLPNTVHFKDFPFPPLSKCFFYFQQRYHACCSRNPLQYPWSWKQIHIILDMHPYTI